MKNKKIKALFIFMIMLVSCDEPETTVTNIVHPDGSVTRIVEMRSTKNNFEKDKLQVSVDSSWNIKDSLEIGQKGDTTWVKRAVRLFKNAEEINTAYLCDSGVNRAIPRSVSFSKHFHWFSTKFRFSEIIEKRMNDGYPVANFLNEEELKYFYTPDKIRSARENGPDSLKYRQLSDSIQKRTDEWLLRNVVSLWIRKFSDMVKPAGDSALSFNSLKKHEIEMTEVIRRNENIFDSLWQNGTILRQFIGDSSAVRYKTEADTCISLSLSDLLPDFANYQMKIVMPGRLTATNGYIDNSMELLWTVKSDYFITERYEMWAESKTTNIWAWIVSGIFLAFVAAGIILKRKSRLSAGPKP